jgi:hypothetical protein
MMRRGEISIPPNNDEPAVPGGTLLRRIKEKDVLKHPAPPCLKRCLEAVEDRNYDFHASVVNSRSCAFLQRKKLAAKRAIS